MGWTLVGHWRLPSSYEMMHLKKEDADGLPSHWRRKFIPKMWYFLVNAGAVFFLPFLSLYWRNTLGYTTPQIGLLQALRPWTSAASGNLLAPLADLWNIHYVMLLVTYSVTITSRGLLSLHWSYGMTMVLALCMEAAVSPMGILVDSTVVAGSTKDGTYGRARLWASVGWGAFAPVAGAVLEKYGVHACFMAFAAIYAAAFIPTALIPAGLLGTKYNKLRKTSSGGSSGGASSSSTLAGAEEYPRLPEKGASVPQEISGGPHGAGAVGFASGASRRRSRRSEAHSAAAEAGVAAPPARRSSQTSEAGGRRASMHVTADARGGTLSREDEVVVEIAITPAGALGGAKDVAAEKLAAAEQQASGGDAGGDSMPDEVQEGFWLGLRRVLADVYVLTFMFKAFMMGVGNGFIGYLFLLLSDQGATGTLLGLCLTVNCVAEVPVFYYSGALIKKLGVELAINLAMGAYCVRLAAYALLPYYPTVWVVLVVELLQGATFALAWSAGTVHCRRIAPKRLVSTVQGIYSGLYSGFGSGVGGLVGGMLYGAYGGQVMCTAAAGALLGGWILASSANLVGSLVARGVRGAVTLARRSPRLGAPPPSSPAAADAV